MFLFTVAVSKPSNSKQSEVGPTENSSSDTFRFDHGTGFKMEGNDNAEVTQCALHAIETVQHELYAVVVTNKKERQTAKVDVYPED